MDWVKDRHKDPMSSNKGNRGQEILQVSRSCLISQHRPSTMLPASFLPLWKSWHPIFTPCKSLVGWEMIYGNSGESTPWHPLLAFAYQGSNIVFRFIIEYSNLMDFGLGFRV
jgi:hypothetical protein